MVAQHTPALLMLLGLAVMTLHMDTQQQRSMVAMSPLGAVPVTSELSRCYQESLKSQYD